MNTSLQYHQPVLEALCAFVREGTIGMVRSGAPATDIQATLTVVGRRNNGPGLVDLAHTMIAKAVLPGVDLTHAFLIQANLSSAFLVYANLSRANLFEANLTGAKLGGANLIHADLTHADLTHADLSGADLTHATLSFANLTSANLLGANLIDVELVGANLSGANLSGVRNLSQRQLDGTCGTGVRLPAGLTLGSCLPPATAPAPAL